MSQQWTRRWRPRPFESENSLSVVVVGSAIIVVYADDVGRTFLNVSMEKNLDSILWTNEGLEEKTKLDHDADDDNNDVDDNDDNDNNDDVEWMHLKFQELNK